VAGTFTAAEDPPPPSASTRPMVVERPRPLPPIGHLTSRWNPQTSTLLREDVEASHAPSMVGAVAVTRLCQWLDLDHWVIRERRR
jgi:hypothetical protein